MGVWTPPIPECVGETKRMIHNEYTYINYIPGRSSSCSVNIYKFYIEIVYISGKTVYSYSICSLYGHMLSVLETTAFLPTPVEADDAMRYGLIGFGLVMMLTIVCFITDLPTYYQTFLLLQFTFNQVMDRLRNIRHN